jgi:LPS-assembly protein
MNLRFYTVYLALLSATETAVSASNGAWNCEQDKNGQWTCLNQGQEAPQAPQAPASKPQKIETALPAKPADSQPTTASSPVQAAKPAIEDAAQPANIQQASQPEANKVAATAASAPKKQHVRMEENQKPVIEQVAKRSEEPAPKSTTVAGKPGWTCQSGNEKANWNCNLVGQDTKGEPHSVAETESLTPSVLSPTFSQREERTFQVLRNEFAQDPWQNCSNWSTRKQKSKAESQDSVDSTTLVDADSSEVFEGEVLNFAGNVDLHRGDKHLKAEHASYDTVAETMDAQGNVLYSETAMALSSDTLSISMNKDEARLRNSQFIIAAAPFRGTADTVYRDNKDLSRYQEVKFTSCPPGNQDWVGHAEKLKVNRDTGQGAAKNAWIEFKGVPVLYTPYISFPTDNRRLSGLLAPTWGRSQRNGIDISAPIYLNLAPNFDDLITPRYMARRGEMLMNKFRYLTGMSEGQLRTDYLPYDSLTGKSRYLGSFKDKTTFSPNLHSVTNLNYVSDKLYFNDLNNPLGIQTNRYLPSTAFLNYDRPDVNFAAGIQHYQSLDQTLNNRALPYDALPKVSLNLDHQFDNLPLNVALNNQYAYFYNQDRVNGQRFNIAPSVSFPLESSAGFFIPKITGQYTHYQLSNQGIYQNKDSAGNLIGMVNDTSMSTSISRTLPIFSVDSGMTFERDTSFGSTPFTNTLEPRAFYLYIPRKDQSNIPLFDTAAYDTNFYSLFRENKYSGLDRIQDANQITLAASSRFINGETGLEPLKVSLGQIVYFQNRTVNLDYNGNFTNVSSTSTPDWQRITTSRQASTTSNFIGEISGQISHELSYLTGTQWDPANNNFARNQVALKYRNNSNQILNIGYRYRKSLPTDQTLLANELALLPSSSSLNLSQQSISQSDISFRLPLFNDWYGLGRWQYSFNYDKTSESFIGLEKENCCWRVRLLGRRYLNGANFASINPKPETAFFIQLELKGFTSFGDSVDQFLQRNINGFQTNGYYED